MSNELLFFQALSSAMALSGVGLRHLFARYKMKKRKNQLFVCLVSRKCGTTTALKACQDETKDRCVLVDALSDIVETQDKPMRDHLHHLLANNTDAFAVKVYPLVKQYIDDMRRIHKRRPVVLFTSDVSLVKFLRVPDKQVVCCLPNINLSNKTVAKLNEEDGKLYTFSREKLITQNYEKILFNSQMELQQLVEKMIGRR